MQLVATHCRAFTTEVAYAPGFLGFREVPAYLDVWASAQVPCDIRRRLPMWMPSRQLSQCVVICPLGRVKHMSVCLFGRPACGTNPNPSALCSAIHLEV